MRRLAWWTGGAIALYAAIGFLAAPPVVRGQLERLLGERLGREIAIERARVNPFALSVSIHGLRIRARDGAEDAAGFDELYVNLSASSLLRFAPIVEAVRLSKPFIRVVRHEDGGYSFQDILDRAAAPAEPPGSPVAAPRFAVYNVVLADGRVEFDDRPKKARHAVTGLQVGLPFVSSLPAQIDVEVQPRLSLKFNGAPFEITGETKPFKDTLETLVRIDIDDLQLARYLEYSPVPLRFKVPSGRLDTRLGLTFAQGPGGRLERLTLSGSASLQDLKVEQADGAPLVSLGQLAVHLGSLDFLKRHAIVNSVRIEKPELDVVRSRDGRLNLLAALPATDARAPAGSEGPPFSFSVADLALSGGRLRFTDQTPAEVVRLAAENVSLSAAGVGNAPEARATLKLAAQAAGGKLGYDGALELAPPRLEGTLEAAGLRLRPFAPYVEQVLRVAVTGGALSTRGRLSVEVPQAGPVRAAYRADASVMGFASLDKASSQELLRWKSLALKGIEFELDPLKIAVDQVSLSDFYSRLIVNADGTLNLQTLGVQAEAPAPQAPAAPPRIRIGAIAVRSGTVNFSDYLIKPNFTVLLTGVGGGVTEMTPERAGEVELRGRVHETAPLEVAGRVNPLAKDLFLDLKAGARDIELPPLTPYAAKYAGYGIEKGKLSLKLAYRIEDRKLVADHNINLDQLTFGERVESPSATQLPVLLAVALLKDRNGVIDIDLPVSGSLDDPEFSVGGIVLKAFVNLIVKAVTSPFALLGAMVGGGEELAFLEFAPGSAKLDAGHEAKLKSLAQALTERPGLRLDASGRAEPGADREALKRAVVERQVKAAKLKDTGARAADAASLDEVVIEPGEYQKYLTAAYRAASFERPRNVIGLLKDLPVPEMEKLMLDHAQVSEEDLRQLADARARAAKAWLVENGKVAAERVFVVAPRLGAEGIKDKGAPTRVDFALK